MCFCGLRYLAWNAHASSVARPAVLYFFLHYLINSTIFEKKIYWTKKCVFRLSLQLLSETFLILRRTERDMIKNAHRFSCKVPIIPVIFLWNLNFLDTFSKNTQISDFMKTRPVGTELFHAHKRTDMTKLTVAFRNFESAPNNPTWYSCLIKQQAIQIYGG